MKNTQFKKLTVYLVALGIGLLLIQACNTYFFRSNYQDANALLKNANNIQTKPFLKAHLKNGDVCILKDTWQIDTLQNLVSGNGIRYDFNRNKIFEGAIPIPIDSVSIFETNRKLGNTESKRIAALTIMAGLDAAIGVICLINPKACFGSCPTFYINEEDNFHYADAEGFSNAISPSMEYFDIDALNNTSITSNSFSITMKNEALETHCVNNIKLLAFPRKEGERVYQSPNNGFYLCENSYQLRKAHGMEGEITSILNSDDRQERFSLSDADNLNSKEEIILTFDNIKNPNDLGLILNFRQTLMTTYLFYSAMGYMGDNVSDVFAQLESDSIMRNRFDATIKILGGIDVYLWNDQSKIWEFKQSFNETGPIAINRQFVPLQNSQPNSKVKIKLILNKGFWRVDYVGLTNIKEKVIPLEIPPISVLNKGKLDNTAMSEIINPDKHLISMPGSEYKYNFTLPKVNADYELFLYSKGYYLEWMREHWIKDKDLLKLKQMVDSPKKYLREEAKNYKKYEATMEEEFWNSKIDTQTLFSYHEK